MATNIVHNTGTNFTLYYNILNYFKTIMQNHPSIAVVTQGDIAQFDYKQYPEYPIGNVLITDLTFGTSITTYQIQLTVADKIKNKNNESSGSVNALTIPYFGVNDVVDIHANTAAIINDLTAYTQRGVAGFEINGDIDLKAFSDEFNNGLAGWVATFELTTHNDKNRCLFFLINPEGAGTIIQNCDTGDLYRAVLAESGSIGQVFATSFQPFFNQATTNYSSIGCYTIVGEFTGEDRIDYVNLPILAFPYTNFGDCTYCKLWTTPQIWGTTPQNWNSGSNAAFRWWGTD
ncbi:hypothetical protein UFOVP1475_30 [uncultured Caudovirales phage]|uniref:Uncharacterized protein n=1 Tax=uncultured Caudovirales phage TaxID=2100421 RepID=A0A6J5SNN9_9CAUD|nr:hypothetical protein UFOVP1475_30 [uncultured Caudovirales phage]